jgi:hypothetical protein
MDVYMHQQYAGHIIDAHVAGLHAHSEKRKPDWFLWDVQGHWHGIFFLQNSSVSLFEDNLALI